VFSIIIFNIYLYIFYILCPAQFLLGLSKGTYGKKSKNSERKKIVPTNPYLFSLLLMSNSLIAMAWIKLCYEKDP